MQNLFSKNYKFNICIAGVCEGVGELSNNNQLEEIRGLKEEAKSMSRMKQEKYQLPEKLDQSFQITVLDSKDRKRNLVITAIAEESDVTGWNDGEKVRNVIVSTGYQLNCGLASRKVK